MADARTELLRRVPIFSGLKRDQLAFVATRVDEVDVPAGKVLVTQGDPNHALHIIVDGEAEVSVDQKQRRNLGAGDFFGEISMLDRRPATATVRASRPLRLLVLSHAQFRDAIKGDPELTMAMLTAMCERLDADAATRQATSA
jgi:CRP-like cAMP-binding protein